jgi:hypothetical protein
MEDSNAMPIQTVRETLHLLGYLNARYGRPERAIGYFELMTVVDAMNPTAWRTLATIQLALEKNPEASASASKALELGLPPDEEPLCHLVKAISARRLGNPAESDAEALEFLKSRREEGGGL